MASQVGRLSPVALGVILGAALVVLLLGIRVFAPVINPILLSLLLAVILLPLYQQLRRTRLPDGLALLATLLVVLVIGVALLLFVRFSMGRLIDTLPDYQAVLDERLTTGQETVMALGIPLVDELDFEQFDLRQVAGAALNLLGNVTRFLTTILLVFILVGAALFEQPRVEQKLTQTFGEENLWLVRLHDIGQSIQSYIILRTKVNVITGSAIGALLLVVGTDFALLWGLLAVLLSYIPYIGLVLAAIPPVLLTWLEFGLTRAVIVIVGITAINIAVEDLVSPTMMSRGMSLAPMVVLGSILFWGFELGVLGFLLSVPLTVILVYILAGFDETRWIAMLMSGESPEEALNPETAAELQDG